MNTTSDFKKQGYLWAHVGTGDMMELAIGHNVPRVRSQRLNSSKSGPLSVIASDEQTFQDLTLAKMRIAEEVELDMERAVKTHKTLMQAYKEATDMQRLFKTALDPKYVPKGVPAKPASSFDKNSLIKLSDADLECYATFVAKKKLARSVIAKKEELQLFFSGKKDAVSSTTILRTFDVGMKSLDSKNTKLYVIGHGGAGKAFIFPTPSASDRIPLRDIASGLAKAGLPAIFEDVRLTACYSADAKKPAAFTPGFDPPGSTGGVFGFFQSRAPAQVLSNKMAKRGFKSLLVTGYHGAGIK